MSLTELNPITVPPEALQELALVLRLPVDFDDAGAADLALDLHMRNSIALIERLTQRALLTRSFLWRTETWPCERRHGFPVDPVIAVSNVQVVDAQGDADNVSASLWTLNVAEEPARLNATGALPGVAEGGWIEITFDAGFGVDWISVPQGLRHAVLRQAATAFEARDGAAGDTALAASVPDLLSPYRRIRI